MRLADVKASKVSIEKKETIKFVDETLAEEPCLYSSINDNIDAFDAINNVANSTRRIQCNSSIEMDIAEFEASPVEYVVSPAPLKLGNDCVINDAPRIRKNLATRDIDLGTKVKMAIVK
jgi:hypothetical protein